MDGGFWHPGAMRREPWFDAVRKRPDFETLAARAEERRAEAAKVFAEAGGRQLLGMS